jgi:LysR family hydrogen peroxide-inducible transcriptional activator
MSRFSTGGSGISKTFEGSSLETIRHMVASGIGITVLPQASVPTTNSSQDMLNYIPFEAPVPSRRVVIAWRKSYTRRAAVEAVRQAILACNLQGVQMLPDAALEEE